jgi:hypothetical protein
MEWFDVMLVRVIASRLKLVTNASLLGQDAPPPEEKHHHDLAECMPHIRH